MPRYLPPRFGLRYAPEHFGRLRRVGSGIAFLEIDAEAFMMDGGPHLRRLEVLRAQYHLSVHGAGLAIGAAARLDADHLERLAILCSRFRPSAVSEHLAWASPGLVDAGAARLEPYTAKTLARSAAQVDAIQARLGRPILIETPLTCGWLSQSTYHEGGFLDALAARTGCGLLLDLANVIFSARFRGISIFAHATSFPLDRVEEIHLPVAGSRLAACARNLVADLVEVERLWGLYALVSHRAGPKPTLLDWQPPVPSFSSLVAEADRAARIQAATTEASDAPHA